MPAKLLLEDINSRLQQLGFQTINVYHNTQSNCCFTCPKCGRNFTTQLNKILVGHTKSCGCIKGKHRRKGTYNVPMTYFSCVKQHAAIRQLEFAITIEYISELLEQQNFKCALSNLPICLYYGGIDSGKNTASLDRINNYVGYIVGNVQWVHKDVNWMKQDFDENYFISICNSITQHKGNNGH